MNTPIYRRTKETQPIQFPYNFQPAAPFGEQKEGERERCVKGLPAQGRAGISEKQAYPCKKIPARLWHSAKALPNSERRKVRRKSYGDVSFHWVSLGYHWGTIQVLYGQHSLQKRLPCGIMEAQISREVSYHGERMFSDCGNKMRGSSRTQEFAPDVSWEIRRNNRVDRDCQAKNGREIVRPFVCGHGLFLVSRKNFRNGDRFCPYCAVNWKKIFQCVKNLRIKVI